MTLFPELAVAVSAARREGWAICDVAIEDALSHSREAGIPVVGTRPGSEPIGMLRPTLPQCAPPLSLSAAYGRSRLPLHTDGANRRDPPSIVLLSATGRSSVETVLLRLADVPDRILEAARRGVFLLGGGRWGRFVHALDRSGRVRFDPGCMRPADPEARLVCRWLADCWEEVVRHPWADACRLLVIDNHRTLHGRMDASTAGDTRVLRRLMLEWRNDAEPV